MHHKQILSVHCFNKLIAEALDTAIIVMQLINSDNDKSRYAHEEGFM